MTKYINLLCCSAMAIAVASPASASIINLYDLKNFLYYGDTNLGKGITSNKLVDDYKDEDYKYECDVSKWIFPTSHRELSKMDGCVSKKYPGGTSCMTNCKCSKSQFPYTADSCSGNFVAGGETCTDPTGTYYASCSCASGLVAELWDEHVQYFKTDDAKFTHTSSRDNSKSVTCYNRGLFKCKDGYEEIIGPEVSSSGRSGQGFLILKEEPYITYYYARNDVVLFSDMVVCITGVKEILSPLMVSEPTDKKCASYDTASAKYFPSKQYYYYTGNCNEGGANMCSKSTVTCMAYNTETFNSYNPGTNTAGRGSCKFVTGCKTGVDSNGIMCDVATKTKTGMAYTNYTDQNQNCIKITGCATGYTQKMFQSVPIEPDPMVYEIESDKYTYSYSKYLSEKDANNEFGFVACAVESGCRADNGYCATDSTLLSSVKSASTLGYTLTSSSSCDGVKIKHPLEDKYICIHNGQ